MTQEEINYYNSQEHLDLKAKEDKLLKFADKFNTFFQGTLNLKYCAFNRHFYFDKYFGTHCSKHNPRKY